MRRRRNIRSERSFRVGPVERQAGFDPLLQRATCIGRQRITFQGHPLFDIGRGNPPKRFAALQIFRFEAFLRGIAGCSQPLECIDAISALGFFGTMARQAVAQQHRRDIALKAEVVGAAHR